MLPLSLMVFPPSSSSAQWQSLMSQAFRFLGSQRFLGQHYDFDKYGIDDFFANQSKQLPQKHQFNEFEIQNFFHRLCRKRISSRRKNANMTLLKKNCLSCFIGVLSGVERIKS